MKNSTFRSLLFIALIFSATSSYGQGVVCQPNMDFGLGNFSYWQYFEGTFKNTGPGGAGVLVDTMQVYPPSVQTFKRFTVTSGAALDFYGGFPIADPTRTYSLKVGFDSNKYCTNKARYYVHVPAGTNDYALIYRYAIVMQDPGHLASQQPRFLVTTIDSVSGVHLPCGNFSYVAGSLPGFLLSPHSDSIDVYYKSWSTASLNLSGYAGKTIIVEFEAVDCALGGHWGYGYFDMTCGLFAISNTSCVIGATTTLIAPPGFQSYQWTDSAYSTTLATTDTFNLVTPSSTKTYHVICTPYGGYGCPDTLTTTVISSNLTVQAPNDTALCNSIAIPLPVTTTGGIAPFSYSWTPAGGLSCTTCASPIAAPTVTTTYFVSVTDSSGCSKTVNTTITVSPSPITGINPVCAGQTTALTDASAGGTWSASNGNATVGPTGIVTAITAGTTTISYTLPTGCVMTTVVTINPLPAPITGTNPVCQGLTNSLTDISAGGTWSASNGNAVIGSTGIVTGIISGTTSTITYTLPTGCLTTIVVSVDPVPGAINGTLMICSGSTTTLTDAIGGGVWSSSNANVSVGSTTGIVTGITAGTSTITYTLGSDCFVTAVVTVNPLPGVINGIGTMCVGGAMTLSDAVGGGVWASSNANATIGTSGVVIGVATGTSTITYTLPGGCFVTGVVTITPTPTAAPVNDGPICVGGIVHLTANGAGATSTYNWIGSSLASATIANTTAAPAATSVYSLTVTDGTANPGCSSSYTTTVTVNTLAVSATNDAPACVGGTVNFTATASDTSSLINYNWSGPLGFSSTNRNPTIIGIASTSAAGIYTVTVNGAGSSCVAMATTNVVVNTIGITAANNGPVCVGGTLNITSAPSGTIAPLGYTWSGPTYIPPIQNPVLSSVSYTITGTYTVAIYAAGSGCTATGTTNVVVNTMGLTATNDGPICEGSVLHLTSIPSGSAVPTSYLWNGPAAYSSTTSNPAISGITTSQGGVYTVTTTTPGSGCIAVNTTNVTVLQHPGPILGPNTVCVGSTSQLSDVVSGGIWSSSDTTKASIIDTSGIVSGKSPGTTTITYAMAAAGCISTLVITVNQTPIVTGAAPICLNSSVTLSHDMTGGYWSSSNTTHATVDSVTGVVSGAIYNGFSIIYYTVPTGCRGSQVVTVNETPTEIAGVTNFCTGGYTILNDVYGGGTWSSTNPAVGSVANTTGLYVTVNAVSVGTTTISYTIADGCAWTYALTVNPIAAVTGSTPVCVGSTITLTDPVVGGTWSIGVTGVATAGSSTGIITGVNSGTITAVYTTAAGCTATTIVTVLPTPFSITGPATLCLGSHATLSEGSTGGTWSSSNGNVLIDGSGNITGIALGTSTISYRFSNGCAALRAVTVNTLPTAVTGTTIVCAGSTVALSDGSAGGTWSSGATSVATVGLTSGIVTGVAGGTALITYSTGTAGCSATTTVTVNPILPITGAGIICIGGSCTLGDATGGGTWSTTDGTVTVGSTGVVTAVSLGSATITYTIPTGCSRTAIVSVNPAPTPITGTLTVCAGATTALTDGPGTWSSGSTYIATVGTSGIVTGVMPGTATITYSTGAGCIATAQVTVNTAPSGIGGASAVCAGLTTNLSDFVAGGTWSTTSTNISLDGSGNVTGISSGPATITYTLGTGCTVNRTISVNPVPAAITGNTTVCVSGITLLSDATPGGASWTSSATTIATVNPTGSVNGLSTGTTRITYALGTGCIATTTVNVIALPAAVTGSTPVCPGSSFALTDASGPGIWSSNNTTIATVGTSSGVVTGVSTGLATVTYSTTGAGCIATTIVTVSPATAIYGTMSMCLGSGVVLHNTSSGGIWSTTSSNIILGSSTGVVTGTSVGTAAVTYTLVSGCQVTAIVTVNSYPAAISGSIPLCVGSGITLSDATPGGTWSSTVNASIDALGNVTGVQAGTAIVSYILPTGCNTGVVVTVNAQPSAINGTLTICVGSAAQLTDIFTGAVWSSSTSAASVGSSGLVTGVSMGTSTISYATSAGCAVTAIVTINPAPPAVTGSTAMCVGASENVTIVAGGGLWSSSSPATATVGSSSGTVTGLIPGVVTISYVLGLGCYSTMAISVNALPPAINGSLFVCSGVTISLSDPVPGGTWSSDNTSVATVGSTTGIVSGVSGPGTVNITYAVSGVGCVTSKVVTVNPTPAAITGNPSVCVGATTALTDATPGGSWTSSYIFNATVIGSTGVVTGVAAGTARITYTSSGCISTYPVTVNAQPSSIGGATSVCAGSTISLSDFTAGGTWSSTANASVVSTGSTTALVTGLTAGTATITYSTGGSCYKTYTETIKATPAAISGNLGVCTGATTTLTDVTTGGLSWTSSNTIVATVTASGLVSGLTTGTTNITYTLASGCAASATVSVTAQPAAITNNTAFCQGSSITLSDVTTGGTWSSSNLAVGTVGVSSGTVLGITGGTATITYALAGAGCRATTVITVNTSTGGAGAITGAATLCVGTTTALTDVVTTGVWSSTATTIATVNPTGVVRGIAPGTATISYTITNFCGTTASSVVVTVNPLPVAGSITGTGTVCTGSTTALTDAATSGVWSSAATTIATVNPVGVVNGLTLGTATISYAVTNSCGTVASSVVVTVNSVPVDGGISGTTSVCAGSTTALTDALIGGVWTSTATSIATVNPTGAVRGIAAGTATISYAVTNTCGTAASFVVVTVNSTPVAGSITGTGNVCAGSTTALTDAATSGVWSSSATSIATVNPAGVVTGIAAGTATISYTVTNSCGAAATSLVVTVNPLPSAGSITGASAVCAGSTTPLTDAVSGGTWSSAATSIATVNPTGVVNGISPGAATISYTISNSCGTTAASLVVTVNSLPIAGSITGTGTVCAGSTTALTDAAISGVWTSTATTIATVNPAGVVRGIAAGTTTISYTVVNSCGTAVASTVVTVNPLPVAGSITGASAVCAGSTTALTDAVSGGTWSATATSIATVDPTGVVNGIAPGTSTISYTVTSSCGTVAASLVVTVNSLPAAGSITGTGTVCAGSTTALTDAATSGVWSSTATSVATVNPLGVVNGVSQGTATISYTVTNSCGTAAASVVVTVNPLPAAGSITGTNSVCAGSTTALTDAAAGGTWSATATSIATVDVTGVVNGIAPGTSTISYTVTNSCGTAVASVVVTVYALPVAGSITGTGNVCAGSTTGLTDAATSGVWSSTATTIATVNPTGVVRGIAQGTATISYTVTNGCGTVAASVIVTVNPLPVAGSITGFGTVCAGAATALTDPATGGTWSSTATGVATVNPLGVVSGIAPGTSTISYTVTNSCGTAAASLVETVNPLPVSGSITGTGAVCAGSTTALTDPAISGVWSSAATTIATVNPTGVVKGVAQGTATISYTVTNSCGTVAAWVAVTVNPLPVAGTITGTGTVCTSSTTALTDLTAGGTWTSSTPTIATVAPDGTVTGVAGGTATISYTVTNSCGSATAVSVVTVTALTAGTIAGATSVPAGSQIILSDAVTGGVWSASNANATVNATGLVTGVTAGTVTISYTVANGCGTLAATQVITVITGTAGINGVLSVCSGGTTQLTDATPFGTWHSSNVLMATVGTSGLVTASSTSTGTVTISYTVSGISTSVIVTVNPNPSGIGGSSSVCNGSSVTMSDFTAGGAWTSTPGVSVTTGSITTTVTGITNGLNTVTYSLPTGCSRTYNITVNGVPGPINGNLLVCVGALSHLTDASAGVSWASSTTTVATINASGNVLGVSPGTSVITYQNAATCKATATVTVHTCPSAPGHGGSTVSGTVAIVAGSAIAIDEVVSGTWSSSNNNVATVDNGVVTGVASGIADITHIVANSDGEISTTVTPVVVSVSAPEVRVVPNPSNGTFTVLGALGSVRDEEVTLEITDVLGKVIYKNKITATDGKINEAISLGNTLGKGTYMLRVHTNNENKVFHLVVEK